MSYKVISSHDDTVEVLAKKGTGNNPPAAHRGGFFTPHRPPYALPHPHPTPILHRR